MNGEKKNIVADKAPREETNKMSRSIIHKNRALKLLYAGEAPQLSKTAQGTHEWPWVICKCPRTMTRLLCKRNENFPEKKLA